MGNSIIVNRRTKRVVKAIIDILKKPCRIDIDLDEIKSVLSQPGEVLVTTGSGTGNDRVVEACHDALDVSLNNKQIIHQASKIILHIAGPSDLLLKEVNDGANFIKESLPEDAEIIFGVTNDYRLRNRAKVTLLIDAKVQISKWEKLRQN